MAAWIKFEYEQPEEGEAIDVWCVYVTDDGMKMGRRIPNCWRHGDMILLGDMGMRINHATHWMYPPDGPDA